MGLLDHRTAADNWFTRVSAFYDPVVAETFWPTTLQRRLLDRLSLSAEDDVLDVGCGTGQTSASVAERAGTVAGVDRSAPQLSRARRKHTAVRVLRADAEHLPFPDDTFDAVVSVGAVIYFPDPVAALTEARRVTRPGGSILVAGFNRPEFPSLVPTQNWATVVNEALFHTWTDAESREQFAAAGWDDIESVVTGPPWHPRLSRVVTATTS
ncbi:class I SAM-dependent methyltransferase [Salinibaculum salinum]|uniref:class I SAM-dependent methyltransferase n=1 Tax=Salinibaculum salinum TaxID=3131996 RepID=UPI0030EDA0F6